MIAILGCMRPVGRGLDTPELKQQKQYLRQFPDLNILGTLLIFHSYYIVIFCIVLANIPNPGFLLKTQMRLFQKLNWENRMCPESGLPADAMTCAANAGTTPRHQGGDWRSERMVAALASVWVCGVFQKTPRWCSSALAFEAPPLLCSENSKEIIFLFS